MSLSILNIQNIPPEGVPVEMFISATTTQKNVFYAFVFLIRRYVE